MVAVGPGPDDPPVERDAHGSLHDDGLVLRRALSVPRGLEAKTITHTCYGNYDRVFPYFNRLPVDQIDLEMSNSGLDLLDRFRRTPLNNEIAFGVIDVHTHRV